jgi:hypothetical protein
MVRLPVLPVVHVLDLLCICVYVYMCIETFVHNERYTAEHRAHTSTPTHLQALRQSIEPPFLIYIPVYDQQHYLHELSDSDMTYVIHTQNTLLYSNWHVAASSCHKHSAHLHSACTSTHLCPRMPPAAPLLYAYLRLLGLRLYALLQRAVRKSLKEGLDARF